MAVTLKKAEKYAAAIGKKFGAEEGFGPQVLVGAQYYGAPFTVVWEEGPYEWTILFQELAAGYEAQDPEFGCKYQPFTNLPKGVYAEVYSSYALNLYDE